MERLLKRKAIWRHEAPKETIQEIQDDLDQGFQMIGKLFKDRDEFEMFWMLPLSNDQRMQLLHVLSDEKKEHMELLSCVGLKGSSMSHRQRCIACVITERPQCAIPFYKKYVD